MKFAQIIEFETERIDEIRSVIAQFEQQNQGKQGHPVHRTVLQDRAHPKRFLVVIEFNSYEEAMINSRNPEVDKLSQKLASMATKKPTFTDCDIREQADIK
ncbi:hypothetical protein [Streptomyces sp. NBC_01465]|uniref:hypothetical protein n=1 Tax=Streptomyces sp. NBC_01465 TaxID=2903878 RepID=UPI002E31EF8D|nr:hypothetical protein [Streptomyces sp. NBC_01465]